ncbi:hypothetical protein [Burkholderia territorii]|uniref:hypothetical protein n=1 Tax=Burkholderia territorii TaxID=1503055 RepID=UPI0012DAEA65|nr:hypothetical protein [Burkholderia territorii]
MKIINRILSAGILICGLLLSVATFATSFDPRNATYPLGDCAHLGLPPVVQVKNGLFTMPGDDPNSVKVIDVMRGVFDGHANEQYFIVVLSCQLWGANYTYTEYFVLGKDGTLIDRLDETRINDDYVRAVGNDGGLWGDDDFAFKNGKLTIIKPAGGSHAEPKWTVTITYQLDKLNQLRLRGIPTRRVIKHRSKTT